MMIMVQTGNPYPLFKRKQQRVSVELQRKAAEMFQKDESIHQVHRVTQLSKPYLTKVKRRLEELGMLDN